MPIDFVKPLFIVGFYTFFTLLAWRRLPFAVLFIVAALPSYLIRFRLGPIPMTLLEGMILIVFFVWAIKKFLIPNYQFPTKLQSPKLEIGNPAPEPQHQSRARYWAQQVRYGAGLKLGIPLLLLFIAATVSIFVAPDLRAAAGVWKAYFVEPILFFLVLRDLLASTHNTSNTSLKSEIRNPKSETDPNAQNSKLRNWGLIRHSLFVIRISPEQIVTALSISALFLSLYAIYQRFTGFGIPPPWNAELRVTSVFPYPNALGLFLGPLVPLFVARFIASLRHPERSEPQAGGVEEPALSLPKGSRTDTRRLLAIGYWLLVTIASILAIVFAKSTGAIVGITAGLIFMGLFVLRVKTNDRQQSPARKFYILHFTFYILVIIGVVAALLSVPRIRTELSLKDWSGHVRRTQWAETWEMLKDTSSSLGAGRPILGAGLAGYKEALEPYHKATYLEIFEYPHNIVLNFWSETGLLGLLAFTWLIILFFRHTLRALEIRNCKLEIPAIASMVVILVHGLVDVPYFKNDLAMLFWIIFALGLTNTQKSEMIQS